MVLLPIFSIIGSHFILSTYVIKYYTLYTEFQEKFTLFKSIPKTDAHFMQIYQNIFQNLNQKFQNFNIYN